MLDISSQVIRAPTIPPKIAFANHAMANIRSSLIVSAAADSRARRRGGRSAFGSHHARFRDNWEGIMTVNKRTKLGVTVAVAVLAGLTSGTAGMLVLVVAWLLIVWGQAPERTESYVGGLPGGNYLLKALARIDQIFWPPDLTQTDLVREEQEALTPEEPGQEDTAQDDEANLAREEYFRDILRGYSPEARRRLHQLNITGAPKSVLDEEWVQFFRDGLVETTYSGRGGVRSELKELIGKLLGEFQDGP